MIASNAKYYWLSNQYVFAVYVFFFVKYWLLKCPLLKIRFFNVYIILSTFDIWLIRTGSISQKSWNDTLKSNTISIPWANNLFISLRKSMFVILSLQVLRFLNKTQLTKTHNEYLFNISNNEYRFDTILEHV